MFKNIKTLFDKNQISTNIINKDITVILDNGHGIENNIL